MKNFTRSEKSFFQIGLVIAGILAFFLRFTALGKIPLSDSEALNALQAINFAGGGTHAAGSEPGYVIFTSIWFFLFGSGNFGARFLPALCGSLFAMTPWLFRRHLGERAALLTAFLLALDAGWLAVSRQAFGMSWAGMFLVLALAALAQKKSGWMGIFSGLSILGGPSIWQGAITLGAATLIFKLIFRPQPESQDEFKDNSADLFDGVRWSTFILWFVGTLAVAGTLLLVIPNGLNAAANSLTEFLAGWGQTGKISAGFKIFNLILAQPLGFFFAAIGAVRAFAKKSSLDIFLASWWFATLILAIVYPAQDMTNLAWVILPMLALAARQITGMINPQVEHHWIAVGQGILVVAMLVFAWLSTISFLYAPAPETSPLIRVIATLLPFFLIIGGIFAVRSWWSEETAGQGALWGLLTVLLIWGVSAAWSGTGLGAHPEGQVWYKSPLLDEVDLLKTSMDDLSTWKFREPGYLNLVVDGVDSPGLRWVLRDYEQVEFVTSTGPASSPAMVITTDKPSPLLADTYRGQDFVLRTEPAWQNMVFDEWLRWIAYKTVPQDKFVIVLWARTDLFPDAEGFNP